MKASLNHIFRSIWSDALNTWVAVSEITSAKGKRSKSCILNAAALAENESESGNLAKLRGSGIFCGSDLPVTNVFIKLIATGRSLPPGLHRLQRLHFQLRNGIKPIALALACCFSLHAQANPVGAQVVSGTASINQSGNLLTVTNSPNAIINWQGFSIGTGQTTNFVQQSASSSVLNRVIGPDPSSLLGTLTSNGRVFLINPAGILVGQGARIDVGGLVTSTLNLSNANFLSGNLNFTATSNAGSIQNSGTITTPEGGSVYLVAPQVENYGVINTPKGETILAAGNTVQIVDTGAPGVTVQITGSSNSATNLGKILADSGQVGVVGAVVKNSGTISANSMVNQGGKIFLKATNSVEAGGTITANGNTGGSIQVLGNEVKVTDGATISANGTQGGGTVLVGGDYQGKNPNVQNAQDTYVAPTATLSANATQSGDGGKLIVWSDNTTQVYGSVSATGGLNGGNGGFIETSGHYLDVTRAADASAPKGLAGTWLLDPNNITITTGIDTSISTSSTVGSNTYSSTNDSSILTNTTIQTALNAGTNVNVTTAASGNNAQLGDITVSAAIAKTAGAAATLTLNASNNIAINAPITSTVGALSLTLNYGSAGSATLASTLGLLGGTLNVQKAGVAGVGTLISNYGTLDSVIIGSNLTVAGNSYLYINNNLTLGSGVVLNAGSNYLYFGGTNTTDHITTVSGTATVNMAGGALYGGYNSQPLQIDAGVTVQGYGNIYNYNGVSVTNAGTVIANTAGQTLTIYPSTFTNSGTLSVTSGTLTIDPYSATAPSWSNTGTMQVTGGTLNLGGSFTTAGIGTITRTGGAVNITGKLDNTANTGTLDIGSAGLFGAGGLSSLSGTITGGTIVSGDGTPLTTSSGTLSGVTIGSNLKVAGNSYLYVNNNLTLGSGVVLNAGSNYLYFGGTNTTDHITAVSGTATVNMTGGSLYGGYNSQPLQIDAGVTVQGYGNIYNYNGVSVTNAGTVIANTAGQTLTIYPSTFTNSGTLSVTSGTLTVDPYSTTAPSWSNTGTMQVSGGTLNLGGSFTTAGIGTFTRTGGAVNITGKLDNTANTGTLDIGSAGLFGAGGLSSLSGTITGGTIVSGDGTPLTTSSGTLSGVTIGSNLTVAGNNYLYVNNNLTLGSGVVLNAGSNYLYFGGTNTTDHITAVSGTATINMTGGSLYGGYNSQPLQIDAGVTVQGYGQIYNYNGVSVTNAGTVIANTAGQTLTIYPSTFTNSGTLSVTSGTLTVDPYSTTAPSWSNTGTMQVSGGTLNLGGSFTTAGIGTLTRTGGAVNITGTLDNTANTGTLDIGSAGVFGAGGLSSLSGTITGGTIVSGDGTPLTTSSGTLSGVTIGSNLKVAGNNYLYVNNNLTLGSGVVLNAGSNYLYFGGTNTTDHITAVSGTATINMTGGSLYGGYNSQPLQIDAGVTVQGYGQIYNYNGVSVTNAGTVIANTVGQTITINPSNFTNSGTLSVTSGTLTVDPYSTTAPSWSNTGTMQVSGGTLNLGGSFTTAGIGTITRTGGAVNITGTLDNTANTGTLDIGSAGVFGAGGLSSLSGTISGGTIISGDGTQLNSSGTLTGVTLSGNLTFGGSGNIVINNGITLATGAVVNMGAHTWYFGTTGLQHIATTGTATLNDAGGAIIPGYSSGGTLQIDSGITLQGNGSISQYYTSTLTNNGVINGNFSSNVTNFTNNGTLAGTGTITVGTLTNNGIISPGVTGGDTTGTLTISGNLVMGTGSSLNVEIDSPLAGDYSVLNVSGTATLTGGTLNLSGWSGTGSYAVVNATGGLGGTTFSTIKTGTFTQTQTYSTNSLTLAVTANSNTSTIYWTGGASTSDWATAANWSNNTVPNSAENLYVGSGAGTVNISTASQAGNALTCNANFTLSSTGGLTLAGASTFRGTTTISGGNLTGTGTITIPTGGTLNWSGGTINGTAASTLITQSGSTFNVTAGTLGANLTWNNSGTLNLTPATWNNAGILSQAEGAINLNGTFVAANLGVFTRTGGAVNLGGTLTNTSNTLDIGSAGLFGTGGLSSLSGTITGGTIVSGDGTPLTTNSGTLSGVTIGSNLKVAGNNYLYVNNNLTLGSGVVLNAGSNYFYFGNTTATDHITTVSGTATVNMAGGTLYGGYNSQPLQIDAGVTVQGYGNIYNYNGVSVTNAGTVIANTAGQTLTINPSNFTNSGTLSATSGTLTVDPYSATAPNWSNTGTMQVSGGTLNLGGSFATAGIGTITRTGGAVNITGKLDNTANTGTLDIGSAGVFGTGGLSSLSGTITGGTIVSGDGTSLTTSSGTLSGVTIGSNLKVAGNGYLYVNNNLTLGSGVVLNAGSNYLYFGGTNTTDHITTVSGTATVNMAGGTLYGGYNSQPLQIDAGVTVQGYGSIYNYYGTSVTNAGTVIANTAGQTLTINPSNFTNSGTLSATSGILAVDPSNATAPNWSNTGTMQVSGGTLNLGGSFTTAGIGTLTRTGGAVNITGKLDNTANTGTLDIGSAGVFGAGGLSSLSGTITGGTIVSGDGTPLTTSSGTLSGVTIGSNLTVAGNSYLYVNNNLTLGSGVVLNAGSNYLYFGGTNTTDHITTVSGTATVNMAGGTLYGGYNSQPLQIDAGVTVQGYGQIYNYYGTSVTNAGTITANTAGQTLTINPSTFTNSGTLSATAGILAVDPSNATAPNWSNAGTMQVSGGTLNLGGSFTTAGIGTLTRTGGAVNITGKLDNTANTGTLDIGSAGVFGAGGLSSLSGTITGGTIVSGDGTPLTTSSGTLSGVTIGSNLTVAGNSYLYVNNNLTLGSGVVLNAGSNYLYFGGTNTTDHITTVSGTATVNMAGGTLYGGYNSQPLQIDAGVTVQGYGNIYNYYGTSVTNAGTITANTAGQTLSINPSTFTNSGTLSATAGILAVDPSNATAPNWSNTGTMQVSGGTLNLGGSFTTAGIGTFTRTGGAVNITGKLDNTANTGTLDIGSAGVFGAGGLSSLSGTITGGTIVSGDGTPLTTSYGTLNSVTIGGNLKVAGNSYLYVNNNLTLGSGVVLNAGSNYLYFGGTNTTDYITTVSGTATVNMAGGTLYGGYNSQPLQIDAGVTVQGYGQIYNYYGVSVTNAGTVIANTAGQTFTINPNSFTNSGTLSATSGTLTINTANFTQSGTINLAAGGTFNSSTGFTNSATGVIQGSGFLNLSSGTLTNDGAINPGGPGIGQLNIIGNLTNASTGNINVAIGGLVPSTQHDKLMVSGTATLGGTLNVTNVTGYTPGATDAFNVLGAGTVSGSFATINTPASSAYNTLSNSNLVWLSLSPTALPSTINAWLLDGNGDWNVAANWTNQAVPTASDTVVIDRPSGVYNVTASYGTMLAGSLLSNENLLISGGSLTVSGASTLNGNTEITYGTVNLNGGATNNGTLSGIGTLNVGTSGLLNQGSINPGAAGTAGTLNVTGNVVLGTSSILNVRLGGTGAGQSDSLAVTGNVTMGGTLNATQLSSYSPVNADTIPFITMGGTASGTFATTNLPTGFSAGYGLATGEAARLIYAVTGITDVFTNASGSSNSSVNLDWDTAGNWSSGNVPGASDSALISTGATASYAVTHATNAVDTISALTINSGNSLNVSAGSLTVSHLTTLGGALSVSGTGSTVLNGGVDGGTTGQVTVSGGSLSMNSNANILSFNMSGGTVNAPANLIVGSYTQSGGMLNLPATFNLQSGSTIAVTGGSISSANSAVNISAAGNITVDVPFSANAFTLSGGTWSQVAATLPSFTVNDFSITGGTFIRALGGDGSVATPYQLADIYGVQGMGSAGMLANSYVLANNIDASGTASWNAGAGFVPIGGAAATVSPPGAVFNGTQFTGTFDGQSHTVSNLTINQPNTSYVGLFGYTGTGSTIQNVGLVGGSVSGASYVGGLVGYNNGGTINNSYATGGVNGTSEVGGLMGLNAGTISNSYATGSVSTSGNVTQTYNDVGGLVGWNYGGTINNSHATGNVSATGSMSATGSVSGSSYVGGLVGFNTGAISKGYATGNVSAMGSVSGNSFVGGLVGENINGATGPVSSISNSYATGSVNATGSVGGNSYVGGLTGANGGTISNSFTTGGVTASGVNSSVGGLVGINHNTGAISNSYATGSVVGFSSNTNLGGLAGSNYGSISNSYSSGFVSDTATTNVNVGGLVGYNSGGTVSNSFWDISTSGQTADGASSGSTGLTTAAMMAANTNPITAGSWDTNTWGIVAGVSTPYLLWRFPTAPQVVSGTLVGDSGGSTIQTVQNGNLLMMASTGADGTFMQMLDAGSVPGGHTLLATVYNSTASPLNIPTAAMRLSDGNNLAGIDLTPATLTVSSNSSAAISNADLIAAVGNLNSSGHFTVGTGNDITLTGVAFVTAPGTNYLLNGSISADGGLVLNGPVTMANNATLSANSNSNIIFNGTLSGTAYNLILDAGGAISSLLPSGQTDINAAAVQITAGTGIGSASNPLKFVTSSLNGTTTSGVINIYNDPSTLLAPANKTVTVSLENLTTGDNSTVTYGQNGQVLKISGNMSSKGGAVTIDPPASLSMGTNASINSGGGAVQVTASGNIILASINAGTGVINLTATNGWQHFLGAGVHRHQSSWRRCDYLCRRSSSF